MEQTSNLDTPPFLEWVKGVVHAQHMDLGNPKDLDVVLLCNKPSQVATHYTRMKAYGNHSEWRIQRLNCYKHMIVELLLCLSIKLLMLEKVMSNM